MLLIARKNFFLLLCCLYTLSGRSQADLSGIINKYIAVTAIDTCQNGVVVPTAMDFQPGEQAILIQMKGASISIDDSPSFGNITSLGQAGLYEQVTINTIEGNLITFQNQLLNMYDVLGAVQLVSMPVFDHAIVRGKVQAQPWDGTTGGVITFDVRETLELEADIDASGAGFRGGQANIQDAGNCSFAVNIRDYSGPIGDWRGAAKGEGVADLLTGLKGGRGAQANGGGGGNDHNSGGGGGANITRGGRGGRNAEPSFFGCKGNFPGDGGKAISADTVRLYLGGGGGAGDENNDVATDGAAGGGIVILAVKTWMANGFGVLANGTDAQSTGGDGAGGGGGGGTILLQGEQLVDNLTVEAKGGKGGDIDNSNQDRCHGAGGGGSGGRYLGPSIWNPTVDVSGGDGGISINSSAGGCGDSDNLAIRGEDGIQQNKNSFAGGLMPFLSPTIVSVPVNPMACEEETLILPVEVEGENLQFQWQILDGSNYVDLNTISPYSGVQTAQLTIDPISGALTQAPYRLEVTSQCGEAFYSDPISLVIDELPDADFSFVQNEFTVSVNNQSGGADNLTWFFGDGNSSVEESPIHTYNENGDYEVTLIAQNNCGTDTSRQQLNINVGMAPSAAFSFSSLSGCVPLPIQFNNESQGDFTEVLWQFTGGTPATSTEENPLVTFTESGVYNFSLIVSGPLGQDTLAREGQIEILVPPVGEFSFTVENRRVLFQNNSTGADRYRWLFGDGAEDVAENPIHTYDNSGSYDVSLITFNDCGIDTFELVLDINLAPQALFSYTALTGCSPLAVQFTNESIGDYAEILWQFPGGEPASSTDPNPVVNYEQAGIYTFTLVLSGEVGIDSLVVEEELNISTTPIASFDFTIADRTVTFQNNSTGADTYRWLLGDGEEDGSFTPSHAYQELGEYEVVLIAENECGQDTLRRSLTIGQAPQALYTYNPTGGCAPVKIQFSNQSKGDYTNIEWTFPGGEPATSTIQNPEVTYAEPGVYRFSLLVEGPLGNDQVEIENAIEIFSIPEPSFTYELKGDTIFLQNNSTSAQSYLWNFGDDETSREENPIHIFGQGGSFNITLNAGNAYCGKSASQNVNVVITSTEEALRAAGISLYPNPFKDWLNIDIEKAGQIPLSVTLVNSFGQRLEHWVIYTSQSVSLVNYPAGLYYVQISSERGEWVSRVVKR